MLAQSNTQRSRNSAPGKGVRHLCPVDPVGCIAFILRLSDHLRRVHQASCKALGIKRDAEPLPPFRVAGFHPAEKSQHIDADNHRSKEDDSQRGILDTFEQHMGSMDGGCREEPYVYRLALKQIVNAVGGEIDQLNRTLVIKLYVEPIKLKRKE